MGKSEAASSTEVCCSERLAMLDMLKSSLAELNIKIDSFDAGFSREIPFQEHKARYGLASHK